MLTEQMTSLLTSCHIQHVCLHYKSVDFSGLPQTTINTHITHIRLQVAGRRWTKCRLKILNRLWKKWKNVMTSGGIFWTHTVHVRPHVRVRVQRLTQTCQRMRFGQWWTFWAYYVK